LALGELRALKAVLENRTKFNFSFLISQCTLKDDRPNKGTPPSSTFPETRPMVRGDHAIKPTPEQRKFKPSKTA